MPFKSSVLEIILQSKGMVLFTAKKALTEPIVVECFRKVNRWLIALVWQNFWF